MATLGENARKAVWKEQMNEWSLRRETVTNLSKQDLRAAIDAADDWVSTNSASFNSALPVAARTNLTAGQKAELLALVVRARYTEGV